LQSKRDGIDTIALNLKGLSVHSVKDETEVHFEHEGENLRIKLSKSLKRGEQRNLRVEYSGKPPKGLYFRKPDSFQPQRPLQLWTQGEDEDSHYWFPCIDFPGLKLTSEIIAHVPKQMTARFKRQAIRSHGRVRKEELSLASG